jgi:hypothetical protein
VEKDSRLQRFLAISLISVSLHLTFPLTAWAANPVYSFSNAASTGYTGPTQAQVNSAYTGSTLAGAVTVNTQGIQEWVVPTTGYYGFEVVGGHGAAATGSSGTRGGRGAFITARKTLTAGTRLFIVVGQAGTANSNQGGGGGASFLRIGVGSDTSTLIVAGGGGGNRIGSSANGGDASVTTSGTSTGSQYNVGTANTFYLNTVANSFPSMTSTPPQGTSANAYTRVGYGGLAAISNFGDGGAGWLGDGYDDGTGSSLAATKLSGSAMGGGGSNFSTGGFGGGGNGAGSSGGGGGGGYTGGNSGHIAGGGGSFVNGFDTQTITIDTTRSFTYNGSAVHGYVTISYIAATSPNSVALSISGNATSAFKGISIDITATVGTPGIITFFANGKRIPGCINKDVATSVICTWKPPVQGSVRVSATFIPTDIAYSRSTSSVYALTVSKRTTTR